MNYDHFPRNGDRFNDPGAVIPRRDGAMDYYDSQMGGYYQAESNDNTSFFDFWGSLAIIMRRKWLILAIVVLGMAIATLLTLRQTPLYSATATIEIQRAETQILQTQSLDPNTIADNTYMATQYALLRSRSLAERVAEVLDLPSDPRYANQSLPRPQRLTAATNRVLSGVRVIPEGRSRIIRVEYISPYKQETARVANAIVENFIESNLERKFNASAYSRNYLEQGLADAKAALELSERQLASYANAQDILEINTTDGGGAASLDADSLIALNQELAETESERIDAEQRYKEALANPDALFILQNEDLRRLRESRSDLMSEYREMLGTFKPEFPAMVNLQARIDARDVEIEQAKQAVIRGLDGDYQTALARERLLRNRIEGLKGDLQDLRNRTIGYTLLQREVDSNRQQYEGLLQEWKEISIASGVTSSQVAVVDRALVPGVPFSPNLSLSLIQAFVLSLAAGIGLAFGLNYIDDTIKSAEDVKSKLGLPAIGVIPKVPFKGKNDSVVESLDDPKSGVSEAFFAARTALNFATANGVPKSLVVTSTQPGEGKTSSTISLAMAFAKIGHRVLVIDADMRKPSFVADPGASIGLSGLLTRDEPIADQIITSEIGGLHLLPSGIIPPNPAELLSTARLASILREVEAMFDIVIVDSPPVLSFADSPLLGSVAEGALIVVEAGKVRRPGILRTIERMVDGRSNLLGVILTKFDAKKFGYDYAYYNYGYGGRYTEDVKKIGDQTADTRRKIRIFAADNESKPSMDEDAWHDS